MIDYVLLGTGASITAGYAAYCHISFYKDLKKTIVKKQAHNKDRYKTLDDVFRKEGVYLLNSVQPRSGIPPQGDIGTFFLKPTIHLAKTLLMQGKYDCLAEEYAKQKAASQKN